MQKTTRRQSQAAKALKLAKKALNRVKNRCHHEDGTLVEFMNPRDVEVIYLDSLSALVAMEQTMKGSKIEFRLI